MKDRMPPWPGTHVGRVRFYEYRPLTWLPITLFLAVCVGAVYGFAVGVHDGRPLLETILVFLFLLVFGAVMMLGFPLLFVERQHIRVDDAGLWVGQRDVVRPEEILDVRPLRESEARTVMRRRRWNGTYVNPNRSTWWSWKAGSGTAVVVVIGRPMKLPPVPEQARVLATRNAEGLASALIRLMMERSREDFDERRPQPAGFGGSAAEHQQHHRPPATRERRPRSRRRRRDPDRRGGAPDRSRS